MIALVVIVLCVGVHPVFGGDATVGGWAGIVLADDDKDGSLPYFDAHPWYLYVQAKPAEGWRFFGEVEAEHIFQFKAGKEGAGEFKLDRLYIERNFNTRYNFRAGKVFLPFGYWYRLHWHFLTETLSRPISFNNQYVPRHNVGLQSFGTVYSGSTSLMYNFWVGNGPDVFGANQRTVDTFGSGGSFYLNRQLGGSYRRTVEVAGGHHAQTIRSDLLRENQRSTVLAAEVKYDGLETRYEHYWHSFDGRERLSTWYANGMYWVVPNLAVNFRYEQGDDLKNTRDDAQAEATAYSYGLIYKPEASVLIKAEYRVDEYKNPLDPRTRQWNLFLAVKY